MTRSQGCRHPWQITSPRASNVSKGGNLLTIISFWKSWLLDWLLGTTLGQTTATFQVEEYTKLALYSRKKIFRKGFWPTWIIIAIRIFSLVSGLVIGGGLPVKHHDTITKLKRKECFRWKAIGRKWLAKTWSWSRLKCWCSMPRIWKVGRFQPKLLFLREKLEWNRMGRSL